jgi:hypothetical protein
MAILNYAYLKLKMPSPHRIITVGGDLKHTHLCERENYDISRLPRASPRGLNLNTISLRDRGA